MALARNKDTLFGLIYVWFYKCLGVICLIGSLSPFDQCCQLHLLVIFCRFFLCVKAKVYAAFDAQFLQSQYTKTYLWVQCITFAVKVNTLFCRTNLPVWAERKGLCLYSGSVLYLWSFSVTCWFTTWLVPSLGPGKYKYLQSYYLATVDQNWCLKSETM